MKKMTLGPADRIDSQIRMVRGERVMLDEDLARIYGVQTKRLNEQVRRNPDRFPSDFVFQLTRGEADDLRSQIATSSRKHGGRRSLPYAFTEHGAIMAANVLNSTQAVHMSVYVVRAFVKMRGVLHDTRALTKKLADLEAELKSRLDVHEVAIVEILQRVIDILNPPPEPPAAKKREIGFHVKHSKESDSKAKGK